MIGILKAKDLAGDTLNPAAIADIARRRRALVVPETVSVIGLMRNFQEGNHHIILVADEFGIIQGLVTTHDLWKRLRVIFRMKTRDALSNRLREVGRQRVLLTSSWSNRPHR